MGLTLSMFNQALSFAVQAAYVFALRSSFARQSRMLRERPGRCLAVGLAACAGAAALGYLAFIVGAANNSMIILGVLTLPAYLALAAGGAVTLATLASVFFTWDIEEMPYRCLFAGQAVAVVAGAIPRGGALLVALYVGAGVGAILLCEVTPGEEPQAPRIGWTAIFSSLVLAGALSVAFVRARDRLNGRDTPLNSRMAQPVEAPPIPRQWDDDPPPPRPAPKEAPKK